MTVLHQRLVGIDLSNPGRARSEDDAVFWGRTSTFDLKNDVAFGSSFVGVASLAGRNAKADPELTLAAPETETTYALGDDVPDDISTMATLAVGGSVNSQIDAAVGGVGDKDFFRITLQANQTYVFSMVRNGVSGIQDAYIELHDAGGTIVAENDDGGILTDSLLMFRPTTTGTYYVAARGFNTAATGGYTLSAQAIETGSSTVTSFGFNGKPFFSWTEAAYQLTREGASWASAFGQSATVTYSFRSTAPTTMPIDTGGFSRFNDAQIVAAEAALQAWAQVANINFVRVGTGAGDAAYSNNATIVFGNYSTGAAGAAAFATLPGSGNASATSAQGDVWVNVSLATNANPVVGEFGPHTLLHEIGHALGLSHPGDYDAEEGVEITYAADAEYHGDSRLFTVMSYFATTAVGGAWGTFASTPQLHDIAAMQRLYGVNTNTRSGDTIYGFNSNAGRPEFSISGASQVAGFTIWDGGGNDTLDLSGYSQDAYIELVPEAFMSAGGPTYNIVIARGVVIENAIGGSGADRIWGNEFANRLEGGAGNDLMNGREGNDELIGGAGPDDMHGNEGDDILRGGDTFDFLYGDEGDDQLFGDAGGDTIFGWIGNDHIFGGADNDFLLGEMGSDIVHGDSGDDALRGGSGSDQLFGDAGADALYGEDDSDILDGGLGADAMQGGAGDDTYVVDAAGDIVSELAGEGRDTVFTSAGAVLGAELRYTLGGNVEDLAVAGFAGAINLFGNALSNLIVGNGAINALDGGAGADTLIGGGGDDLYFIDDIGDVIIEGAGEGRDTVYTSIAYYSVGDNAIEDVAVSGGSGSFVIGNALANLMVGGSGADALDGGSGADFMVGGAGGDTYFVDDIGDIIVEGAGGGRDTVYTSVAFYSLGDNEIEDVVVSGGSGSYVIGNALANLMVGNTGIDALDGGAGADFMVGGAGSDNYFVDNIGDVAIESAGEGRDTVYAAISYQLGDGEVEDLALTGSGNLDASGNALSNLLVGNGGDNGLRGHGGADVLVGGAGSDRFVYGSAGEGGDVITDFVSGADRIQVAATGFGGGLVAGGAASLVAGAAPAATQAFGQFLYNTGNGQLLWDADGTGGGAAVLLATLSGAPAITASDIEVVSAASPLLLDGGGREELAKLEADGSPEVLVVLDGEALIGGWERTRTFDPRLARELEIDAKLADGSPAILPGAWEEETGPWLEGAGPDSAGGEAAHAARNDLAATFGPHAFGPGAPDPLADFALRGLAATPEWSVLEG